MPVTMRQGVRLGVDVGTVRIGVAKSDLHGILATPVTTVRRGDGDIAELARLAVELDVIEFVAGLPVSLSGANTASTEDALLFARRLLASTGVPVRVLDERLTTVSAARMLRESGRSARTARPVIDQVAATIILQNALDVERSSGTPPGELAVVDE